MCLKSIEKELKVKNKTTYILLAILIVSTHSYSQAVPPPIPPPPPPGLPIDGGVIFLLLGGLFYGVKKIISKS